MSEVKRYYVNLDHGTRYSPVDGCDQAMNKAEDFDRVTAERDALQQRLTAADERVDVLETALRKIKVRLDAYAESDMRMPEPSVEVCQAIADAALKPAQMLPADHKCSECDSEYCHGVCVERGDSDDRLIGSEGGGNE